MRIISEETAKMRAEKFEERRQIKELNRTGDRLIWLRKTLRIKQKEISAATGIPMSSYNERESGVRTDYYEEQLALASFFDSEFQDKYKGKQYPVYEGRVVYKITAMWLMFGHYETYEDIKKLLWHVEFNLFLIRLMSIIFYYARQKQKVGDNYDNSKTN